MRMKSKEVKCIKFEKELRYTLEKKDEYILLSFPLPNNEITEMTIHWIHII